MLTTENIVHKNFYNTAQKKKKILKNLFIIIKTRAKIMTR